METEKGLWSAKKYNKKCTLIFKTKKGIKPIKTQTSPHQQNPLNSTESQIACSSEIRNTDITGGNTNG